jgi:Periplasmic binding protein
VHEEDVLGLIGPSTTPCAIALLAKVEAAGIPAIHWAGTDQACGNWRFQFQAGYFLDERPALAHLLARRGHERAVCFRGDGAYGEAYLAPFLEAAAQLGIAITGELAVPVTATNLDREVEIARSSGAQALVAMGLFSVGVTLAIAIRKQGWTIDCYGNCGFALGAGRDARNTKSTRRRRSCRFCDRPWQTQCVAILTHLPAVCGLAYCDSSALYRCRADRFPGRSHGFRRLCDRVPESSSTPRYCQFTRRDSGPDRQLTWRS